MKKINTLLFIATAGLIACQPLSQKAQSSFDDSSVFSNEALTRYALSGVYMSYAENGYGTDYFLLYGPNTDVEVVQNTTDADTPNLCRYSISPTVAKLDIPSTTGIFGGNFRGIERANIALRGLEQYGNIGENKNMAALYGEALTVRALLYTDLMNLYGEVPARFEPITTETKYLPKADKDVLYKQLLSDLEQAADMMDFKSLPRTTQAGKACALGMYARLAMQAAGYSLRPDEGKVNTGDPGTVRKSNDPELQAEVLYPKALKALQQIIDYGGFHLYDKFEELWQDYCNQNTSIGKEVIYALPVNGSGTHLKFNAIPDTHVFPAQENMNYNGVQSNLYFRYAAYDQRRDVTCYPTKIGSNGVADGTKINPSIWYNGKFRISWMKSYKMASRDAADQCKYIYLRYADVLLMASELANALPESAGGGLQKAKEYMRPVLVRAFQNEAKADAYLATYEDTESFQEAIMEQRALEFAGEGLRRTDLIRWGILKKTLDECAQDIQDLRNRAGRYSGLPTDIYWRVKPGSEDLELYGTTADEQEKKTVTDPDGGWNKIGNFYGRIGSYRWELMYKGNPDEKTWRPIPASIITANMGVLVNDYGYTL